jgi:hypothetical protein
MLTSQSRACDFHALECDLHTHECDYDTLECDFHMHECDLEKKINFEKLIITKIKIPY